MKLSLSFLDLPSESGSVVCTLSKCFKYSINLRMALLHDTFCLTSFLFLSDISSLRHFSQRNRTTAKKKNTLNVSILDRCMNDFGPNCSVHIMSVGFCVWRWPGSELHLWCRKCPGSRPSTRQETSDPSAGKGFCGRRHNRQAEGDPRQGCLRGGNWC